MKTSVKTSPMASLKRSVARNPIAAFLLILYPVSWIVFLPPLLGKAGLGVISVDIPAQVSILLLTLFGLTGMAFLVTRIADGKEGTRSLRQHFYQFRAAPQWYLLAVFGAPVLLMAAGLVTQGTSALAPIGRNMSQLPTTYLLNLVVIAILISIWEEGGWMAFMTARLQRRVGPVWASAIVAPLWGLIHFPLLFINGGVMDVGRPQGGQVFEYAFYLLVLFSVPTRLVVTWVFNSTRGSLPLVALLHASIDTTAGTAVLTTFFPTIDGRLLYVAIAVVAAAVIVITGGRLGYQRNVDEVSPAVLRQPVHA